MGIVGVGLLDGNVGWECWMGMLDGDRWMVAIFFVETLHATSLRTVGNQTIEIHQFNFNIKSPPEYSPKSYPLHPRNSAAQMQFL